MSEKLLSAVVGGTVIDGNGGPPIERGVVLIEGRRIIAVDDRPNAKVPAAAIKIDATGKYVIPGLMDANVHLFLFPTTASDLVRYEGRYQDVIAEAAQISLKNGLTTVFDTWGPRHALTRVRDQIACGEETGSRIFFAGNIIGLGGPTSSDYWPVSRTILSKGEADIIDARWEQGVGPDLLWMTPEQVRARVRQYIEDGGQNFIKYAGSGHTHMQFLCFSEKVQRAIVEEGHRAAMVVQSHTTSAESLRVALEVGCDLLQHPDVTGAMEMPDETLNAIARSGVPCATLFVTRDFLAWNELHGVEPMKSFHRVKDHNDSRLIEVGANLLLTSDSGVLPADAADNPLLAPFAVADDPPFSMGEAHFHWLKAAGQLGLSPMKILMAATRNIARAYKVEKDLGTLEKGKFADLLILDRNPLESTDNYRSIRYVMKEGAIVDRNSLPRTKLLTVRPAIC